MDQRFATAHKNAADLLEALASLPEEQRGAMDLQFRQQTTLARLYADLRMDIITIRNRFSHSDPKLSWVLTELWAKGFDYDTIHCSFCRGGGESYSPPTIDIGAV